MCSTSVLPAITYRMPIPDSYLAALRWSFASKWHCRHRDSGHRGIGKCRFDDIPKLGLLAAVRGLHARSQALAWRRASLRGPIAALTRLRQKESWSSELAMGRTCPWRSAQTLHAGLFREKEAEEL
eukprot:scaffold72533_cov33-Tisochrysis_lutea.AAC.1